MLNIFGDYLTAHSVISIALLGISIGGLIGFPAFHSMRHSETMIGAALLLPISIVTTYGAVVSFGAGSFLTAVVLVCPFALSSTVITVAMVHNESHRVYFVDLLGAAAGALLVGPALGYFREESSLLFLSAFASVVGLAFVILLPRNAKRGALALICLGGSALVMWVGVRNLDENWLNIVREKLTAPLFPPRDTVLPLQLCRSLRCGKAITEDNAPSQHSRTVGSPIPSGGSPRRTM